MGPILRIIFLPFTLLYGCVTFFRNMLYNMGVLKSVSFDTPIILVGNLSTGGTGKSPMVSYIAKRYAATRSTVILSRGYMRRSRGFVLAKESSSSPEVIGDEPAMFYRSLQPASVAVCEDRVEGVRQIIKTLPNTQLVVMDDGYQHRAIDPGFKILLTPYHKPYFNDHLLPAGRLREFKSGAKRANVIVVTKCPDDLSEDQKIDYINKIQPAKEQQVFFTGLTYSEPVNLATGETLSWEVLKNKNVIMVTGIADPEPMKLFMQKHAAKVTSLVYGDHHIYTTGDIDHISSACEKDSGVVITTEKDAVRLNEVAGEDFLKNCWYLPLGVRFLNDEDKFLKLINEFVGVS